MNIDKLIQCFEEKPELPPEWGWVASEKVVPWNPDEPTPEETQVDRLIQGRLDDDLDVEEG